MGKLNELKINDVAQVISTLPTPKTVVTGDGIETLVTAIIEDIVYNEKVISASLNDLKRKINAEAEIISEIEDKIKNIQPKI